MSQRHDAAPGAGRRDRRLADEAAGRASRRSRPSATPPSSKADEYLAGLQRERAEFAELRRRTTEEREQMLGLAGEDLIRKVLALADDFDLAIEPGPAEIATSRGSRASPRSTASSARCSRARASARSTPRLAPRSIPASTRRSPTSRARAARTARSSRSCGAATASATGSSGRRSSPSRRTPTASNAGRPAAANQHTDQPN